MGIVVSPDSELGRELARWNTPRNRPVTDSNGEPVRNSDGSLLMGMNCVGYEPYPKMLFMARLLPNGKPSVGEVPPIPMFCATPQEYEQKCLWAESFTRQCQKTVHSEQEERLCLGQGWSLTQDGALARHEEQQQEYAELAAKAAYAARAMTTKAQAELAAADKATHEHVMDVVGSSAKTRGQTEKIKPVTGSSD